MINLEHNFLFCHNEKCAGTSIQNALRHVPGNYYISTDFFNYNGKAIELMPLTDDIGNELGHYPNQHIKMGLWRQFIGLSDYFSFGIAREPAERMISLYLQQIKDFPSGVQPTVTIDETLSRQTRLPVGTHDFTFDWFCRVFVPKAGSNQTIQFCDTENNMIADFVGRYENLENDWKYIQSKVPILQGLKLPNLNTTINRPSKKDFFTPDLLEFFYDQYSIDYEVFGYEKG